MASPKIPQQYDLSDAARYWERILAKIEVTDSGCWVWLGFKSLSGYGMVMVRSARGGWISSRVHRVTFALTYGQPDNRQLHHECHNRACVNPEHLRQTTPQEHGSEHRGDGLCHKGHPLIDREFPSGHKRYCPTCMAARDTVRRDARHEGIPYMHGPKKESCKRGHQWIDENGDYVVANVMLRTNGKRECKACHRDRERERLRRRASPL